MHCVHGTSHRCFSTSDAFQLQMLASLSAEMQKIEDEDRVSVRAQMAKEEG